MNYKIEKTLKKNKKLFIWFVVLWVVLSIVLVMPVARSITDANTNRNI